MAFGRRILVSLVDDLAASEPDGIWAAIPLDADLSRGFRDLTWRAAANAVDRLAWWLHETLGGQSRSFETVGYIGAADVRYYLLVLAANKTGHKMMFSSPRNSLDAHVSLLDRTDCAVMLRSAGVSLDAILARRPMIVHDVPSLAAVLDDAPSPTYPYRKTFDQARADPYVVFHSSGSTGLPKPVTCPQDLLCTVDAYHHVPPFEGRPNAYSGVLASRCSRFMCCLPFFHVAGFIMGMAIPAYFGITAVFAPSERPLTVAVVDETIDFGKVDCVFSPPSILEDITKDPASLERLRRLRLVIAGAGPLSMPAGQLISDRTFLAIWTGATETHVLLQHDPDPEDWRHFLINSEASGIEWHKQPDRDVYEMVYVKRADCAPLQGIFKTFRNIDVFPTGDLYEKHPTKPHRWRLVGRQDDLVVLANGEKVQPRAIEEIISAYKNVKDVIVVGQGRFQLAAILELREYPGNEQNLSELLEDIWPLVEKANAASPAHGRLLRPYVMFAAWDKPFARVGKGTVSRPATIDLYASEIERLYQNAESSLVCADVDRLDLSSPRSFTDSLKSVCEVSLGIKLATTDEDILLAGVDSLKILSLAATLRNRLKDLANFDESAITSRLIFEHSSVTKLAQALLDTRKKAPTKVNSSFDQKSINNMVDESIAGKDFKSPQPDCHIVQSPQGMSCVLLTGSSGWVGSHILDVLISDSRVRKIICINRHTDADAQRKLQQDKGLSSAWSADDIDFLVGDMSLAQFGVGETYNRLLASVTSVIHCQWQVDFNMPLRVFGPLVSGVSRLAEFAAKTLHQAHVTFISSQSTVQNWPRFFDGAVPEDAAEEARLASSGYGASKTAATLVLRHAGSAGNAVSSTTVRIGQVAGPVHPGHTGVWPRHEWLPSLVASSKALGVVPTSLGSLSRIDWIPVDEAAHVVCDIAAAASEARQSGVSYRHVVAPRAGTWEMDILPAVQEHYAGLVEPVSFEEWVSRLRQSVDTGLDISQNPAAKLLDFFDSVASQEPGATRPIVLATASAERDSETLRILEPVSRHVMGQWLDRWHF